MTESDELTAAWNRATAALPVGWTLDRLQCASASLAAEHRSEDWIAVAIGPDGEERSHRATDAAAALTGLAASLHSAGHFS